MDTLGLDETEAADAKPPEVTHSKQSGRLKEAWECLNGSEAKLRHSPY